MRFAETHSLPVFSNGSGFQHKTGYRYELLFFNAKTDAANGTR
jgi:hypothetical protein